MSSIKTQDDNAREKLPMEKKFDQLVYGGISYAAQAIAGSGLTYWVKHSSGRPIYDKIADWMGPNVISKFTSKRGKAAVTAADSFITVSTMVVVGTLFVIPVKWLEDMKANIVEKWTGEDNKKREARGETIAPEEKQHQTELLEQLQEAPKQNWWSLLTARAASLVFVYSAVPLIGDKNNKAMEGQFKSFTDKIATSVGAKKLANTEAFKNASGIAFYDGFYSMISAGGLYIYSHFIAPPKQAEKAQPQLKTIPAPETAPEEVPYKHTTTHTTSMSKKSDSFVANLNTETPNAQMAI